MSYLQFHLLFVLPPIAWLALAARRRLHRTHVICLAVVALIAIGFALPWDHAAVKRGIWNFDDTKVLGRLWLLPFEEIAFFILEVVLVCLLCVLFLPRESRAR